MGALSVSSQLGASLGPRHTGGGTPTPTPSGLTAPTLTKTSSGGQQLAFTVTFDASYVGKYFHLQLAANSGFTTPLSGEGAIRQVTQPIIAQDLISGPVFAILADQPDGPIFARLYVEDDSPASSAASNTVSATVTTAVNALVMVQEGDSITAWGGTGHADLWTAAHGTWTVHKQAASGNGIADMVSRSSTGRAYDAQVLTVLIGANDLTNTTLYPTTTDYFNALVAFTNNYRSDGAKVVVGTTLPQTGGSGTTFNTRQAALNVMIKAALGTSFDAVADYTATALGPYTAPADTTLYGDGLHPTDGTGTPTSNGQGLYMLPQYTAAVNYALGVANQVKQFTFTDNGSAAASTPTPSNAVTMIGLAYNETKVYSVSTGHDVRKNGGSWVTNGTGTVTSGDTLEVRATASATPGAAVNVVLTVGTVTDTFTITTASAALTPAFVTGAAKNDGFGAPANFTGITTSTGKKHVVEYWYDGGGAAPTALSLDGTAMTKRAERIDGTVGISCWDCVITTGGSGKALAVTQGGAYANGFALWTVESTATFVTSVKKADGTANDPQVTDASISIPSGGAVFVGAGCRSAVTFTANAGTAIDGQYADATEPAKFCAAHLTATGVPSLSGAAFAEVQMLAVSYSP